MSKIRRFLTGFFLKSIIGGTITLVLFGIVIKGIIVIPNFKASIDISSALIVISFVLAAFNYLISALYRRSIWRIIPCCAKEGSPVILTQMLRLAIIFLLTFAYSAIIIYSFSSVNLILYYRAFNRLFHSPYAATLESLLLFIYL